VIDPNKMDALLLALIAKLDIPDSHYRLAVERYESLSRHFHRQGSVLVPFEPHVSPQGSFRYGTVIRPYLRGEEYDLDLVVQLAASKKKFTQRQLKELVGIEVQSYAEANNFNEPATEKRRCWRLDYADDVSFHMDILPAAPDDADFISLLVGAGVDPELAALAVVITDVNHHNYNVVNRDWPRSNPRGYGRWFEAQMIATAMERRRRLVEGRAYASVDDVPAYEWKTPLQRSIQLYKRHRDVMFNDEPGLKPISMILTTLAARAYRGETNLYQAVTGILDRMPEYVQARPNPRVPNPVNPAEDFADRWASNPKLEDNFWAWHKQAKLDFGSLTSRNPDDREDLLERRFDVNLRSNGSSQSNGAARKAVPAVVVAPAVRIATPPRPWGR
jgi:hypothetical protein